MSAKSSRHQPRGRGEAGESLAELLVTVAILAIAVTTIVGSMAAAIALSNRHRQQATAGTVLGNAAESVKAAAYVPCPATYAPTAGYTVPTGYTVTVTAYQYWDGTNFVDQPPCPDSVYKLQKVTIKVTAPLGYSETVDVVKRDSS
jgi:type II secretory pathway pseudopilin PulG